jgi:hypothetical protein
MAKAVATANGRGRRSDGAAAGGRVSYDAFKEFKGKQYTGMKIGRGHNWRYDSGVWTEKKVTPDKWEFRYNVVKRRRGNAPEGSGVPAGTEYHWYILADQTAKKLDANSYTTEMVGLKFKLAHKRADKETWSASDAAQKRRLVQLLKEMIAELESQETKPPPPVTAESRKQQPAKRRKNGGRNERHLAAA